MEKIDNLLEVLSEITSENILENILEASPFDDNRDIGGQLTKEIFFQEFFVKNDKNDEFATRIRDHLLKKAEVISILGFGGVGKTTFIQDFIKNNDKNFIFSAIDCTHHANPEDINYTEEDINLIRDQIEKELSEVKKERLESFLKKVEETINQQAQRNSIAAILQIYLITIGNQNLYYSNEIIKIPRDIMIGFMYFLKNNQSLLHKYFSNAFKRNLQELYNKIDRKEKLYYEDWELLISRFEVKDRVLINGIEAEDGFLLLLLIIEYNFNENPGTFKYENIKDRSRVIVFDNLDILPSNLLHNHFLAYLMQSIKNWESFFKSLFGKKSYSYKFILFLRDVNSASINKHVGEHTSAHHRMPVEIYVPERLFYKDVVTRRLKFYKDKVLPKILNEIKKSNDIEKERKIISTLEQLVNDEFYCNVLVPAFNMDYRNISDFLVTPIRSFINNPNSKIFYDENGIIKDSFKQGFRGSILFNSIGWLGIYKFLKFRPDFVENESYCLPARMLLSVILNKSKISNIGGEFTEQLLGAKKVRLTDILETTKNIYSIKEVLQTLTNLFLSHKDKDAYLVSFVNKQISENWFNKITDENADLYLKDDFVKLTPSGIIFLEDLIVHYEFYSQISRNTVPLFLFLEGIESTSTFGHQFRFEDVLYNTLYTVKLHNKWMVNFFNSKFKQNSISNKTYLETEFVFKYVDEKLVDEGVFHITRIVSHHIEYINNYRKFLLKQNKDKSKEILVAANKAFIEIINEYKLLFNQWEDDSKMVVYKKAIEDFENRIKNKSYMLYDSDIYLNE